MWLSVPAKGYNSGKGHNPDGKKYASDFFMKNPYMKFQNPSVHVSEVMLCIKKRNGQTDGRTRARTSQKQYAPPTSSKLGSIIMRTPVNPSFTI